VEQLEDRLNGHKWHSNSELKVEYAAFERRIALETEVQQLKIDIKNATQDLQMKTTLKNMKRVLRRLGHTTGEGVIDLKGRVACEISTCDELLGTNTITTPKAIFRVISTDLYIYVI
jgi:ATP-dependent RNA helicase DOB1